MDTEARREELREQIRKELLGEFSRGVDAALAHREIESRDAREFLEGFRDALVAGNATVRFEEAMEEESDADDDDEE